MERKDFKTIKELPLEFDKGSWKQHYKQIYHDNDWYIYEMTGQYGNKSYEVFSEHISKCFTYDKEQNKFITFDDEGFVAYPSDEIFGSWASAQPSIEGAMAFIEMRTSNNK